MPSRTLLVTVVVATMLPLLPAAVQGQPSCTHVSHGGDLGEESSWSPGIPDLDDVACLLSGVGTDFPGQPFFDAGSIHVAEGAELRILAGDGPGADARAMTHVGDLVNEGTIVLSSCAASLGSCPLTPGGTAGAAGERRLAALRATGRVINDGTIEFRRGVGGVGSISGTEFLQRGVLDVDIAHLEVTSTTLAPSSRTRVTAGTHVATTTTGVLDVQGPVESDGWFTAWNELHLSPTAELRGTLGIESFGARIAIDEGAEGLLRVVSGGGSIITSDVPAGMHVQATSHSSLGGSPGSQAAIFMQGDNHGHITLDTASRASVLRPDEQPTFANHGVVDGSGDIIGMVNHGVVDPGPGPGRITVQTGFTQGPTGVLALDVGATDRDELVVVGDAATLDGQIHVTAVPGDAPAPGTEVLLVDAANGASGPVRAPTAAGTLQLGPTGVTLTVGDGIRPGSRPPTRWTTHPDTVSVIRGDEVVSNTDLAVRLARLAAPLLDDGGGFAGTAGPAVLLGREDVFADAVASGGLQGDAVLLLVPRDGPLPPSVRQALSDLDASAVTILGGEAAVSAAVAEEVAGLGLPVDRLAGTSRFETATTIAAQLPAADTAVLVRAFPSAGTSDPTQAFADSIAAGGMAAENGWPVLLTDTAALNPSTAAYLEGSQVTRVLVLGGTAAVSDDVVQQLQDLGLTVERIAGSSRADTAVEVAKARGEAAGVDQVLLVDGQGADSWVAGFASAALSGATGAPIVLSAGSDVPLQTKTFLEEVEAPPVLVCASDADACAQARTDVGREPAVQVGTSPAAGTAVTAGSEIEVTVEAAAVVDGSCVEGATQADPGTTTVVVRASPSTPSCTLRLTTPDTGQVDWFTFATT